MRILSKNNAAAGRRSCGHRQSLLAFSVGLAVGLASTGASAGPEGGVVTAGTGTITQDNATTTIGQSSSFLGIDWQTFNVAAHESVLFRQPGSSAVALNRIHDQNPSQIFGTVSANGQLFLVNANGIFFGRTAQLNVGSLVASSLDVLSYDAVSGRYQLGGHGGAIVNDGSILASPGGSVSLIGGSVANNGLIVADFGTVNLASGTAATLDFFGGGLMRFEIDGEVTQVRDGEGSGVAVGNAGTIQANGGQVFLTAEAAQGVFDRAINNEGVVRANRIENVGGTIHLLGAGGIVTSSGVLDASGTGGGGGTVSVLGDRVGLFDSALVDVSGDTGGGTALVGGDFQGRNPDVLNSSATYVGGDATIRADAGASGDGGRVIVWSDGVTVYRGTISANGGTQGGDGGFAEVSGKDVLNFDGDVRLQAIDGVAGTLLLDPDEITIVAAGGADDAEVDDGSYLFEEDPNANSEVSAQRIIEVLDGTVGPGTNVVLQADDLIDITASIDASGNIAAAGRSLTFQSGDDIIVRTGVTVATNNGDITMRSDLTGDPEGPTPDNAGVITMEAGSSINAGNAIVTLAAAEDITVATVAGGTVSIDSNVGAIVDDGDDATRIAANTLTLQAATGIGDDAVAADQIDTTVADLDATADAGGIFIEESDGLAALSAQAIDEAITVVANGNVVLDTVTAGNGAISIDAGAGTLTDGVVPSITTSGTATLNAAAIGADTVNRLDTDVGVLSATADTGTVFINEASGLTGLIAQSTNQAIDVVANGNVVLTTVNAGNASVDIDAGAGTLTDGGAASVLTTGTATLTAASIGTDAASRLDTNVGALTTSTTGDQFINEANGLTLNAAATAGAVNLTNLTGVLNAASVTGTGAVLSSPAGSVTLGTVNVGGGGTASVTTNGAILDDLDNATRVTAGTLTLSGSSIGAAGANNEIDTTATTLNLNAVAVSGSIFVTEADGATIASANAGATGTIAVTSTTGDLTLGAIDASATGTAVLRASAGSLLDDGNDGTGVLAADIQLSAANSIGTVTDFLAGTGSSIDVNTTNILSASVTSNTGDINLNFTGGASVLNAGAITLGAGASNGEIVLQSAGNLDATSFNPGSIVIGAGNSTDVALRSGGTLTVPADLTGMTDSAPETLLLRGTAAIVQAAPDPTPRDFTYVGRNLVFESGGAGGAVSFEAGSDVERISATLGGAGALTINDANSIIVDRAQAGGNISITGATGAPPRGDVTLGTVATPGDLVVVTNGSILDDDNQATRVAANVATLDAFVAAVGESAVGGFGANGDLDTSVDTFATVVADNGSINISNDRSATIQGMASTGTNVAGVGGAGADTVVSTSAGNLTLSNVFAADEVLLSAAAGSILDDNSNGTGIIAPSQLTLTAGNGAIGASGVDAEIDTRAGSLTATAANGGIFVRDIDALNLQLNAISASGAGNDIVIIKDAGAITDDGNDATRVSGGSLTLNSSTSIGAAGSGAIDTQVDTLAATSTAGGVFVAEQDSVTITGMSGTADIVVTAGDALTAAVDIAAGAANAANLTSGGAMTVGNVNGASVALTSGAAMAVGNVNGGSAVLNSGGNLSLGTVNVGAGDATLLASGAITDAAGTTITATNLTLQGSAIGSAGNEIGTAVTRLAATSTAGGIFVSDVDGIQLNAVSATGAGNDIAITAGGAITDDGDNNTRVAGGSLTLNGTAIGAAGAGNEIDTQVTALTANASAGGVFIAEQDALTTAGITGTTDVVVSAGGSLGATGDITAANALTLTSGDTMTVGNVTGGSVSLDSAAAMTAAGDLTAVNALTLASGDAMTVGNVTGGSVSLDSAAAMTAAGDLTAVNALTLASGDAMTVGTVTGGSVSLDSGGALTFDNVDVAAGTATLVAAGAVQDTAGSAITAGNLTVQGTTIGTAGNRLDTNVATLTSSSTGDQFLSETDGLTLNATSTGGAIDVINLAGVLNASNVAGTAATLSAPAGSITLGTVNVGGGNVSITTNGAIADGAVTSVTAGQLTLQGATIGTSANRLDTAVGTLTSDSTGDTFVTNQGALALTANAATGSVNASSTGAMTVTNVTGNSATLSSTGAMTLTTVDVGAGSATLTATGGALTDGAAGAAVTAGTLAVNAGSIGSAANRLDTAVTSITATTTSGGMFISEADGVLLNALTTGGTNSAIDVLALGAIQQSGDFTTNRGTVTIDGSSIAMTPAAVTSTGAGADINYIGRTGDVTVGFLDSSSSDVFIAAGDSILSNGTGATDIRGGRVELRVGATFDGLGTAPLLGDTSAGDALSIHINAPIGPVATVFVVVPLDAAGNQLTQPALVFGGTTQGAGFNTPLGPAGLIGFFDTTTGFRILAAGEEPFPGANIDLDLLVADSALTGLSLSQATASDIREYIDWSSFDPDVSLFGTIGNPVRLPADQVEEEEQISMNLVPSSQTLVMTRDGLRLVKAFRPLGLAEGGRYFN